jgi:hypothetical protein
MIVGGFCPSEAGRVARAHFANLKADRLRKGKPRAALDQFSLDFESATLNATARPRS